MRCRTRPNLIRTRITRSQLLALGNGTNYIRLRNGVERELKRYFSNKAQETLNAVFDGIDVYRTQNDQPVIVEAGPEKPVNVLFRARVFHNRDQVDKAPRAARRTD